MTRPLIATLLLAPLLACAKPCQPRITQAAAIRIAKKQLAKERDSKSVTYYGPYTAELRDCVWRVRGATPLHDVSGDMLISVDAVSGKAHLEPTLRTDPRKIRELREKPH